MSLHDDMPTLAVGARRLANRLNAKKSTGPKTKQGKEKSRINAVTHGLRCQVVTPPEDRPPSRREARSGSMTCVRGQGPDLVG